MTRRADVLRTSQFRRQRLVLTALLLSCLLPACDSRHEVVQGPLYGTHPDVRPVLRLAVHPLHNPLHLMRTYQPLVDHLQTELPGYRFELEASRDYASFERKIEARAPALLLPNPLQTLTAIERGYTVVAMAGDPEEFRGVLLVPVDSPIRHLRDLKGRSVSFPAPTALAAAIMPQRLMQSHGLQPGRDVTLLYVGSQESSMVAAIQGMSDAASTWLQPWHDFQLNQPEAASRLRVLAVTPPLVNNAVMLRNDLPATLRTDLTQALLGMHLDVRLQPVLSAVRIRRFNPATNATYQVVAEYLASPPPQATPPAAHTP